MRSAMRVPGVFRNADTVREVGAGTVIFDSGDLGEEMFGIIEGEVELRTPRGAVFLLGVDDTFGEMAVVDHSPRSAKATATADTKLAVINRKKFLFLIHETPTFALQVMASLAQKLRDRN
jgi:CRP-like cAMP-binding protein